MNNLLTNFTKNKLFFPSFIYIHYNTFTLSYFNDLVRMKNKSAQDMKDLLY